MLILGIDSSSIVATVAILSETKLLAEYIVNNKRNHAEKLMSVIDRVLKDSFTTLDDIDAIAVTCGPGSFTGIRIGMAQAQGIAHALDKPLIAVNTLDGLSYNLMGQQGFICPVVDAQRGDVYTSLYKCKKIKPERLWGYELFDSKILVKRISKLGEVTLLGDGIPVIKKAIEDLKKEGITSDQLSNISFAHPILSMPRASSVAAVGLDRFIAKEDIDSCYTIKPFYIRKSSAEEKWEEQHGAKNSKKYTN